MGALFSSRHKIRFHDTDRAGMAFHGAFIAYYQDAFEDLLESVGFPERDIGQTLGVRVPVAHISVDFERHPKAAGVTIEVAAIEVGRTSMTFTMRTLDEDGTVCSNAKVVRVAIDDEGRPKPVPPALRDAFARLLPH